MDTMTPAQPTMMVSPVVQLVNESDTEFSMKYGPRERLVLAPGASLFVNEEVAWHFLGRWWTDNANPRIKARQAEFQRVRTLYGAYEDDIAWKASRAFHLKAYDPTGKQIITVVDDPDGELTTGGQTGLGTQQSLEAQLEIMRGMVMELTAKVESQNRREVNEGQPTVPTDVQPQPAPVYNPSAPMTPPTFPMGQAGAVPVSPEPVGIDPTPMVGPDPDEEIAFGSRLTPSVGVAYDPNEATVEEDAPAVVKTGGRIQS